MARDDDDGDDIDWGSVDLDWFADAYGDELEEWDDMAWFDFLEANEFSDEAVELYEAIAG